MIGLGHSINNKKMQVEVEFKIGSKKYKVIRGMKPHIFEIYCDGDFIDQWPEGFFRERLNEL